MDFVYDDIVEFVLGKEGEMVCPYLVCGKEEIGIEFLIFPSVPSVGAAILKDILESLPRVLEDDVLMDDEKKSFAVPVQGIKGGKVGFACPCRSYD